MTYVLVHLLGDEATMHAGRLVDHVRAARGPSHAFVGDSPPHHEITAGFAVEPATLSAVCVGHGGPHGLGAYPDHVWANADQLGDVFRGRRLYAYACNTAGGLGSLGARAVQAGVAVFVGHEGLIEAPLPPEEQRMVETVASAALVAFIDGQDDEKTLRYAIDDAAFAILPLDIPIDHTAVAARAPNPWSQSLLFDRLALSLRVHRRDTNRA